MAPGITYDNVPTEEPGMLFDGLKFWVGRRVPQRVRWIEQIEQNGGRVTINEKQADMLIGDCARKDQPAGSYSWKFIETSVRNSVLHDKEDFLIGGVPAASRPAGSSQPQKKSRTPFPEKDDQILAAFVAAKVKEGFAAKGNQLYQALAMKHPHHTWQSWLNRWNNRLSHLSHDALARLERAGADHIAAGNAQPPADVPEPVRRSPRAPSRPVRSPPLAQSSQRHSVNGRVAFTEDDDMDLMNYREKGIADGQSMSRVYEILARDKPHHTAQSWRARWEKTVRYRVENGQPIQYKPVPLSPRPKPAQAPKLDGRSAVRGSPLRTVTRPSDLDDEAAEEEPEDDDDREKHGSGAADPSRDAVQDRERETTMEIQQPPGATAESEDDSVSDRPASHAETPTIPARPKSPKQQFYQDWQDFLTVQEVEPINNPTFAGKSIDLWDLYSVATSFQPDERDWDMVAENLGLDLDAHPETPRDIQKWYSENMELFEEDLAEAAGESSIEGLTDAESDIGGPVRQPSIELDATRKSSPPNLKRKTPPGLPITPSKKHAKYSRDKEVPSTPDEILGIQQSLRATLDAAFSGKGNSLSTPLKEPVNGTPEALPALPPPNARPRFEPETQDFRYDPDTQIQFQSQSDKDQLSQGVTPTPSQQLLSEATARTPGSAMLSRRADSNIPDTPQPLSDKARGKQPVRNGNMLPPPTDARQPSPRSRRSLPVSVSPPKVQRHVEFSSPLAKKEPPRAAETVRRTSRTSPTARVSSAANSAGVANGRPVATPTQNSVPATSRPAETPSRGGDQDLNATIERFVSLGYAEDVVIQSLLCTTMNVGLAGVVMESLSTGKGIPSNREGVWTEKDDKGLRIVESFDFGHVPKSVHEKRKREEAVQARDRLVYRHGEERMEQRRQFLQAGRR